MTRVAYLDCVGGLAGDMLLAALIDAGADLETLRGVPRTLGIEGVEIDVERVERQGIGALHLRIETRDDHDHRHYRDIRELVERAELPERARTRSLDAFRRLAEVEGGIHGVAPDDVHFHELGSLDTLNRIRAGEDPAAIAASWAIAEARWRRLRAKYLLY